VLSISEEGAVLEQVDSEVNAELEAIANARHPQPA
jgi:hypothetical protein